MMPTIRLYSKKFGKHEISGAVTMLRAVQSQCYAQCSQNVTRGAVTMFRAVQSQCYARCSNNVTHGAVTMLRAVQSQCYVRCVFGFSNSHFSSANIANFVWGNCWWNQNYILVGSKFDEWQIIKNFLQIFFFQSIKLKKTWVKFYTTWRSEWFKDMQLTDATRFLQFKVLDVTSGYLLARP
jgi:hypothetical protein